MWPCAINASMDAHMVSQSPLLCITVIWFQFISIQSDNKELCTEKKYFAKTLTNFLQKTEQNKRLLCADKGVRRSKNRVSKANTEGDPLTKFYVFSYEVTSEEYLCENFLHVILRISAETRRKLMSVCRTFYGQLVVQNIHITTRNICHPPTTNEDLYINTAYRCYTWLAIEHMHTTHCWYRLLLSYTEIIYSTYTIIIG